MDAAALAGLNSFGIFDVEADRLDQFFAGLDAAGWAQPSRCAGWSVQDVLAHLAGAELYNHACLNADLDGFRGMPAELPAADFVAATVGRLPPGYPLDPTLADALRCLA